MFFPIVNIEDAAFVAGPSGTEEEHKQVLCKVHLGDGTIFKITDPAIMDAVNLTSNMSDAVNGMVEIDLKKYDSHCVRFIFNNVLLFKKNYPDYKKSDHLIQQCADNFAIQQMIVGMEVADFIECLPIHKAFVKAIARKMEGWDGVKIAKELGLENNMSKTEKKRMKKYTKWFEQKPFTDHKVDEEVYDW